MTTFERRQKILGLLKERSGIKVTELADLLNVSEGTIRNDLNALDKAQQLKRVRGGAVPNNDFQNDTPTLMIRAGDNSNAKLRIARWAAELVEDGDAIFLGAGSTIIQIVPYLNEKRDLTIVTNGLDIARYLNKQTNHSIILLGGVLLNSGNATGGLLNSDVFQHLNIHTAFLSGSGFTKETSITERTLEEAELKKKIIERSLQTAILMDSSKLGKAGRFPFAELGDISYFYTDKEVSNDLKEQMHAANVNLMVCGEVTVRSYTVPDGQAHYTIGFANLSEESPFAIEVRRSLERAAVDRKNIDLVIANNNLSGQEALRIADKMIEREVDLIVEYQIDFNVSGLIMDKFQQANIPAIAVDIPMVGATFFGIDNYRAGYAGGEAIGRWLHREWKGDFEKVIMLEEPRAGALLATRMKGQLDGLEGILGEIPPDKYIFLDSGNTTLISETEVTKTLQALPNCNRIVVLCFNSDVAIGALRAVRDLRRENDIVIVGQGGDKLLFDEIRQPNSRIIGSTAYMPERYGTQLLDLALKILAGEPVPPAVYTDHVFLDIDNIDMYYPPTKFLQ